MAVIKLPGGLTVHTIPPPPAHFDPSKASDDELARHGFPRRPHGNKKLLACWHHLFREKVEYFQAGVVPADECESGPVARDLKLGNSRAGVSVSAPSGTQLVAVCGRWKIPDLKLPITKITPDWAGFNLCESWIGIEGPRAQGTENARAFAPGWVGMSGNPKQTGQPSKS